MADESIGIVVTDKVASSISTKLKGIAGDARDAGTALQLLQKQLASLSSNALNQVAQASNAATNAIKGTIAASTAQASAQAKASQATSQAALAQQKLATEVQKTQAAMATVEVALNRAALAEQKMLAATEALTQAQAKTALGLQKVATEEQNTATAAAKAATAQATLTTAQTNGAVAAQNLATAQTKTTSALIDQAAAQTRANTAQTQGQTATQNLAGATANAATAQIKANSAMTQSQTATVNLGTAQTRATTAVTQGATATQRLATEQQRTAVQTANAAAANDRAALAALRLKQAQDQAAASTTAAGSSLASYLRTAAGIVGLGVSVKAIVELGDAYTTLQNKLQNVTTSQAQVNLLTEKLFELADKTRSGIDETSTAFTRFDRSLKSMGKSQEDTLRLTQTVNEALIVSGATSTEAGSALLQLSQAFNSGKLQGDEFRSVAENLPIVLDAVAKATKTPINQVKQLATQGKITSEVLFKAFSLIQDQVDKTFAKTTPTVAQALVVLKNNSEQFFGELNKSIGFTQGLAKSIIVLANNMNVLAAGIAIVGGAFLAYFGSSIVGALATATRAVYAFTLAIATNPIGLLIVAITSAIAIIALFGDKIKVSADGFVTLKDVATATIDYISEGIGAVTTFISATWNTAIDSINAATGGWGENFRNIGDLIVKAGKLIGNAVIGYYVGAYAAIKVVWAQFPTLMGGFFNEVVNFAATAVETVVNSWQLGLGLVAKAVSDVAPDVAKSLTDTIANTKLTLPRLDVAATDKAAGDAAKAFTDAFNKDYVGDAASAVLTRARSNAYTRQFDAGQQAQTQLRGSGPSTLAPDVDTKAAKAAEKRALALQKVNAQLTDQAARMFTLQPQREAQQKLDEIEEGFIQKKIKLTDTEKASILGRLQAIQQATVVQQKYDEIYNDAVGPQRDLVATQTAAQKLLDQGVISQSRYNDVVAAASETYKQAHDPLYQINKDLNDQLNLLTLLPKQREIEQAIIQAQNDSLAKKHVMTTTEIADLRAKLLLQQQLNDVSTQETQLLSNSVDKRKQQVDQLTAINKLMADQKSGFTKNDAITAISGTDAGAALAGSPEMLAAQSAQYANMYKQIDAYRQADLISEQTASAAKMKIFADQQTAQLSTANTFFGNLATLQNSSNKKAAAVGKAAAIVQATINTYTAATGAYASLASIPYVGPFLGAAAAAAAIAAGFINIQQIKSQSSSGYMTGGYTGDGPIGQAAGTVHGQEFIMNAGTTNRLGVDNLQALQSGAASIQGGPSSGSGGSSVGNNGSQSTNVQVPLRIVNVNDPDAALQAMNTPAGERIIMNIITRNPSTLKATLKG